MASTATINEVSISYDDAGKGIPLMLIHGFPLDRRVWAEQIQPLSKVERVIVPDLRGFGGSRSDASFTLRTLAEDICGLAQHLGLDRFVLAGISMGGYVALEFAKKYPAMLKGLIFIDTKAEADTSEGKAGRDKMIALVREKGSTAVAEQMMPKMLAPARIQRDDAVAQRLRSIIHECPPTTIATALAAMRDRPDHTADLPSIPVPTLIIVGDQDAIIPVSTAEAMNRAIPRSQLVVIKDAGHMPQMEQPDLVNQAITGFLRSLAGSH